MNKFSKEIFYEIYPTSYYDSNNDGVGDLAGIKEKLLYLKDLGITGVWLNPFYLSPFKDGGYDVKDFYSIDPRFGTLEDFKALLKEAHKLGIKIILDLVVGHASEENKDFLRSAEPERNELSDLFIWNDSVWKLENGYRLIAGRHQRNACYMVNFFAFQPAFNFGFNNVEFPNWQIYYKDERTFLARKYFLDVMKYWLSLGADGFRVDMADSIVKNDPEKIATIEVWRYLFSEIRKDYPDAFFVSEWSNPHQAFAAGFDADFVLDHWDNFYHKLARSTEQTRGKSLLNGGDIFGVIRDLNDRVYEAMSNHKLLALISGNHDTPRVASSLDEDRLKLFYLILFSLPGVPFIYYGDEIAMKTAPIVSKDGGFARTGSRTPMQWDNTKNAGFSKSEKELYLPVFKGDKNTLKDALENKNSLYYFIKDLIKIRKSESALTGEEYDLSEYNRVLTINRGELTLLVNCSNDDVKFDGEVLISTSKKPHVLTPYSGAILKNNYAK